MRILICLLFSIVAVDFAAAACNINLRVKNETKYAIELEASSTVQGARKSFQVKTRGVPWRSVDKGGWRTSTWADAHIVVGFKAVRSNKGYLAVKREPELSVLEPGKTAVGRYEAVLGCGVKRRYRIDFTCHEIMYDAHMGSPNGVGFTDSDVAHKTRYFPGPKQCAEGRNVTIPIKSCK